MAATKIRGNTQILAGTITNAEISATAGIATSKLADGATFLKSDGTVAVTADIPLGTHKITGLGTPTVGTDAATKDYVDSVASGLDVKASVRAATTANIVLSGTQTIDGVVLVAADRVLVKNQSAPGDNGIYAVAAGAWARTTDADTAGEFNAGAYTFVEEGTANAGSGWVLTTPNPITLGTTALTFAQFTGGTAYTAGAGLTLTGATLDVVAGDASVIVNANELHVQRDAAGAIGLATGLKVNVGNSTVITSNALEVKPDTSGVASLSVGSGGLKVIGSILVVRETPSGAVDGANTSFTLANTPYSGSEQVFLNGLLQEPGAGNDYTISTGTITMLTAPVTGDRLRVIYLKNI